MESSSSIIKSCSFWQWSACDNQVLVGWGFSLNKRVSDPPGFTTFCWLNWKLGLLPQGHHAAVLCLNKSRVFYGRSFHPASRHPHSVLPSALLQSLSNLVWSDLLAVPCHVDGEVCIFAGPAHFSFIFLTLVPNGCHLPPSTTRGLFQASKKSVIDILL